MHRWYIIPPKNNGVRIITLWPQVKDMFDELDVNGDGNISFEEFVASGWARAPSTIQKQRYNDNVIPTLRMQLQPCTCPSSVLRFWVNRPCQTLVPWHNIITIIYYRRPLPGSRVLSEEQ